MISLLFVARSKMLWYNYTSQNKPSDGLVYLFMSDSFEAFLCLENDLLAISEANHREAFQRDHNKTPEVPLGNS